jgi:hypothetical protein
MSGYKTEHLGSVSKRDGEEAAARYHVFSGMAF